MDDGGRGPTTTSGVTDPTGAPAGPTSVRTQDPTLPTAAALPTDGRRVWEAVRGAVGEAVVGADGALRLLLVALLAEGHALIEDVPGVGKTLLARATALALGLSSARVQGTPDLLPADVTGASILDEGRFRFVPGPVFTNILLVDEINRATPRTQSALLEAMQERQVSVEGSTRPLPDPFIVLATQNPIEYEGTFALPEAQLDRFLVRIAIGISRRGGGAGALSPGDTRPTPTRSSRVVPGRRCGDTAALCATVSADFTSVTRWRAYVVALARATRDHADLASSAASPRATVALYRAAQACGCSSTGARSSCPMTSSQVADRRPRPPPGCFDLDRALRGANVGEVVRDVLANVPTPPVGEPAS